MIVQQGGVKNKRGNQARKEGDNEMNIQEQEERDFHRMSPYEFEAAAVQQEGEKRASQRYLLTNFDTWVPNPFWDGIDPSHPEDCNEE